MPAPNQNNINTKPSEVTLVPSPAKDLLTWEAPARPFKKRNREYFTTVAAIVFLLAIILLFIKEWLLIAVIVGLMFVSYGLATVPPHNITNKINTRGVVVDSHIYKWSQLGRFWFSEKWGSEIVHFDNLLGFPRQIQLIISKGKKEEVKKIIEKYLLFETPKKTFIDKATAWLSEKIPLEIES